MLFCFGFCLWTFFILRGFERAKQIDQIIDHLYTRYSTEIAWYFYARRSIFFTLLSCVWMFILKSRQVCCSSSGAIDCTMSLWLMLLSLDRHFPSYTEQSLNCLLRVSCRFVFMLLAVMSLEDERIFEPSVAVFPWQKPDPRVTLSMRSWWFCVSWWSEDNRKCSSVHATSGGGLLHPLIFDSNSQGS